MMVLKNFPRNFPEEGLPWTEISKRLADTKNLPSRGSYDQNQGKARTDAAPFRSPHPVHLQFRLVGSSCSTIGTRLPGGRNDCLLQTLLEE